MRDWKKISKRLSEDHPKGWVLLDAPEFSRTEAPEWAAEFNHITPHLEVSGPDLRPKDIRQFLWDNRSLRALTRDRAFVWTKYDEDSDSSSLGFGTLTLTSVAEKLTNG
tara:strand:- start:28 stop:354 length:327 start_codon:yes stop_codon:yes gene_type:complete